MGYQINVDIIARLESLGYIVDAEKDTYILNYSRQRIEQSIINAINADVVPEKLIYVVVERVCGDFLFEKRSANQLDSHKLETIVKTIKEGDMSVTFEESTTPEAKFEMLLNGLCSYGKNEILSCRKIRW